MKQCRIVLVSFESRFVEPQKNLERIVGWVRDAEGIHHWPGYSFAIGPDGALLAESARDNNDERMLLVDLDPELREYWRAGSGDFLANRHPETYKQIVRGNI